MTPSRRALLASATASALLVATCFPPLDWSPLAWVAWAPFLALLARAPRVRDAALAGAVHALALFLPQSAWMVVVMHVHGGIPWLQAAGMHVLGGLLLVPYGVPMAVGVAVLARRRGVLGLLAAPGLSALVDVARARLALGHPWLVPGMTQALHPAAASPADLVGVHGLGAVILLANAGVAAVALALLGHDRARRAMPVAAAAVLVALGAFAYGEAATRRHAAPEATSRVVVRGDAAAPSSDWPDAGVRVAIVQGAQPQQVKMRSTYEDDLDLADVQLDLTRLALRSGAEVVIWSESAHPDTTLDMPFLVPAVQQDLRAFGGSVDRPEAVIGALVVTPQDDLPRAQWPVTNSALLVDADATLGRYDKRRLVPFGEYLPLRPILGWVPRLARLVGEMQPGTSDQALVGAHGALGVLICYEIVLPQRAWDVARTGADALVNVTNDGWYHGTWMPEQHLRFAIMRAIETRRFVLRAANSGISAVIAPDGRVVGRLEEGRQGLLLAAIEPRRPLTGCLRWGDGPVTALGLASLAWAASEAGRRAGARRAIACEVPAAVSEAAAPESP